MKVINEIADSIGIPDKFVENYGKYKAKIDYRYYVDELSERPDAKVILVTAINPTPAGEGKTTTTCRSWTDAYGSELGKKDGGRVERAFPWPSALGVKGGAAGGGQTHRWCRWRISIFILPVICTQLVQQIT